MNDYPIAFATGSYDHFIRMWQTDTGHCIHAFPHPDSQVNALAFSRDRRFLAAAGYDHVRLYDPSGAGSASVAGGGGGGSSPGYQIQIANFSRNVNAVGFNDDCQWMYTGGEDGSAKILDLRTKGHTCTRLFQAICSINTVILHRNQCELLIGDESGEIHIWDLRNDKNDMLKPDPDGASIQSLAVNQEGTYFAALNASGNCYVWSLSGNSASQNSARAQNKVHSKYGLKAEFSPDSTLLVCCGADRKINVLKTADFSVMASYTNAEMNWVWDCAFSADSQYLLTASSDGVARLWNLDTGEVRLEYKGHHKAITCLAFIDHSLDNYSY